MTIGWLARAAWRQIQYRLDWWWYTHRLDALTRMEDFEILVQRARPQMFLKYRAPAVSKRREFLAVVQHVHLELGGKKVLDIGPGHGESLDVCHEQGAAAVHFVDYNPWFYTYNRLKGYASGYRLNHLMHLSRLEAGFYDLIWARAAFIADLFEKGYYVHMDNWLKDVDRLAAPGAITVITPHWQDRHGVRIISDVHGSAVARTLRQFGYIALPAIEYNNWEPNCPVTFFKQIEPAAQVAAPRSLAT